ncbi:MAG: hydantoinase/oxoprolinase N-terminal domain-containing protein [Actinomycetota bacterium]
MRVGIDVGGTFTDLAAVGPDGLVIAKVPTTPHDQSEAVLAAVRASGIDPAAVQALAHGMTVATNALLERRGARTALVTTEGFRDVIEIGRQARADLYDLSRHNPPPLVPRELRVTVRERMGPDGVVEALDPADLARAVSDLRALAVESVAVCLLFGYLHPAHEEAVARALRDALPGVEVVASHEVLPEMR